MRKNWRLEPILQIELQTMRFDIDRMDDDSKPCEKIISEDIVFEPLMEPYWHDALFWYKRAAMQNEPLALKMLQCAIDFNCALQKAKRGDKVAQYLIAYYYRDSYGISESIVKSSEWLRRSAINGDEAALLSIKEWNQLTGKNLTAYSEDFDAQPLFTPIDHPELYMLERHGKNKQQCCCETHLDLLWEKIEKLDFYETKYLAEAGDIEKQYALARCMTGALVASRIWKRLLAGL